MSRDFFSRLSLVNQLQPSLPGNAGNLFRVFVCQGDCATTVDLARRRREPGGRRQPARRDIIRVVNAISAEQRPTRLPALKHFRAFLINTKQSPCQTLGFSSLHGFITLRPKLRSCFSHTCTAARDRKSTRLNSSHLGIS